MSYKTISIAINALEEETIVLKKAFELADDLNAKVKVLHINDTDSGTIHMMMDYFPKATIDDLKKIIKLSGFEDRIPSIEFVILNEESPITGILKETTDSDLLVMGHHKKNFFLDFFNKSTDEDISNIVNCPILIIPLN